MRIPNFMYCLECGEVVEPQQVPDGPTVCPECKSVDTLTDIEDVELIE